MKPANLIFVNPLLSPHRVLRSSREQGAALVIVLAFMVMLVGVVVAFFVKASNDRQVADSSASQTSAELFARGAMDTIIGDLRQEIADGSTATTNVTGSITNIIYLPWVVNSGSNVWSNAVPALVGSSGTNGLQNLVKISTNAPFYSRLGPSGMVSGTNRVSSISTTNASLNYRSISAARWNRPLFITPTSATDYTPVATSGFTPPSWIYIDRAGGNPKTWSTSLRFSPTNPSSVIGRYAYAIYDEGGLLDINAAGFPPAMTNTLATWPRTNSLYAKISLAYADLSQLTTAGGTPLLTTNQIDRLINWRNTASLTNTSSVVATAISYGNYARSLPDFLSAGNTSLLISSGMTNSDHPFATRQQLVNYVTRQLGGSTNTNTLQALQYFSTFTRSLNQPSLYWPSNIPVVQSDIGNLADNFTNYAGGNSDFGKDFQINTNFLAVRVNTNFIRNNGSQAIVGEPLVKRRFPLEYLTWITAWGPISDGIPRLATSPADIANLTSDDTIGARRALAGIYFTNNGISWATLQMGTSNNILKYFGLVWNSTDKLWEYSTNTSTGVPTTNYLCYLNDLTGTREPNFIELLKASIKSGSLGKSTGAINVRGASEMTNQNGIHQYYSSTDNHVIQLAANIIEQAKMDYFPVRIRFSPDSTHTFTFSGSEHFPYLYRWHNQAIQVSPACNGTSQLTNPQLSNTMTGFDTNGNSTNVTVGTNASVFKTPPNTPPFYYCDGSSNRCFNYPVTDTFYPGYSVLLIIPHLWDPYDYNCRPATNARFIPNSLRIVADNIIALPGSQSPDGSIPLFPSTPNLNVKLNAGTTGHNDSTPLSTFSLNPSNSAITITYSTNSWTNFTEPICLMASNPTLFSVISDTNLLMGTGGSLLKNNSDGAALIKSGFISDWRDPVSNNFTGIMLGATPITMQTTVMKTNYFIDLNNDYSKDALGIGNYGGTDSMKYHWGSPRHSANVMTFRLQYLDNNISSPTWRDYAYYFRLAMPDWAWQNQSGADNYFSTNIPYYPYSDSKGTYFGDGGVAWMNDPRTARFGSTEDNINPFTLQPNGISVTNLLSGSTTNARFGAMYRSFASSNNILGTWHYSTNGYQSKSSSYGTRYSNTIGFTIPSNEAWRWDTALFINRSSGSAASTFGFYTDPDGVVRPAMGAYVPVNAAGVISTNPGSPTFTATTNWNINTTNRPLSISQNRPMMLHRPFLSVAELGYVFRDIPWKNLDFFTPSSGDVGLLDTFSVHDFGDQNALMAGRVNLNTRQAPVLRALLAGTQIDELLRSGSNNIPFTNNAVQISAVEMNNIATNLIARTATSPLTHLGDLVGQWGGSTSIGYSGFSADLTNCYTNPANICIQRFHESAIRSLANSGQTRVWNLMIDLVAQTGRFPASADSLSKFLVEGERRFWIHVAIDRFTGAVIDCQIEPVIE